MKCMEQCCTQYRAKYCAQMMRDETWLNLARDIADRTNGSEWVAQDKCVQSKTQLTSRRACIWTCPMHVPMHVPVQIYAWMRERTRVLMHALKKEWDQKKERSAIRERSTAQVRSAWPTPLRRA